MEAKTAETFVNGISTMFIADMLFDRAVHHFIFILVNTGLDYVKSLSYQLTSNESKDRVVLIYGDRIQDLKKRDSHLCDMQALQPLPAPTNTANTAPTMTTSGGQPPLPVSETV